MSQSQKFLFLFIFSVFFVLFFVFFLNVNDLFFDEPRQILHFSTEINKNTNFLCRKPLIQYDDKFSMEYFQKAFKNYKWLSDKCQTTIEDIPKAYKLIDMNPNGSNDSYILKFDVSYFNSTGKLLSLNCSAQLFDKSHGDPDHVLKSIDKEIYFKNIYEIKIKKSGFYHIICKKNYKNSTEKYQDVIYLLPKNISSLLKPINIPKINDSITNPIFKDLNFDQCDQLYNLSNAKNNKMNVLVLFFDSTSLNNFKRNFPKTVEYLNKMENNVLFENFNSVGVNTFPNVLPALTGAFINDANELNIKNEYEKLNSYDKLYHDAYPLVWKKFSSLNYVTMFNEDYINIGTFNYIKKGFRNYPTSVFYSPFWFKYKSILSGPNLCHNNEPTFKTSIDQMKYFVQRMNSELNKNTPYFAYNSFNFYLHDYLAMPEKFDTYLQLTLEEFVKKGYLDNTLLILTADHGPRLTSFGAYTDLGKIENSFPLLNIRIPKYLENTLIHENLKKNKFKLVSQLDYYKTLVHFSYINKYNQLVNDNSSKCNEYFSKSNSQIRSLRGVSLFEDISLNRSCADALIPIDFCHCNKQVYLNVNEAELIQKANATLDQATREVLNKLNNFTEKFRSKCSPFKIEKVKAIKKVIYYNQKPIFQFDILMKPGEAVFQADFKFNSEKQKFEPSALTRLSLYKNQSNCMTENKYFGYCYCVYK